MHVQCPFGGGAELQRNGKAIAGMHGGNAHTAPQTLNATFDDGFEACRGDVTRLQRALQCAGQSAGERCDQLVERAHVHASFAEVRSNLFRR